MSSSQNLVRNESSKLPQFIAGITATIGGFVMGTNLGWTSPTQIPMEHGDFGYQLNDLQKSLVPGLLSLGAMVGSLTSGLLANKFGRKFIISIICVPTLIGWILLIWPVSIYMLLIGRFLLGYCIGINSVVCPLYTNEICEVSTRGMIGTYFQLQCTIGILFTYVLGSQVNYQYLSLGCAIFPILLGVLMLFMPETPKFYLLKSNKEAASIALQRLRGRRYDIRNEIDTMEANVKQAMNSNVSLAAAFTTLAAKKGLIIGLGCMFFQQFSGINAVIFFTNSIFQSASSSPNTSDSSTAAINTIIIGSISVVGTYVSTLIIDRLGRKPLLAGSDGVMTISTLLLGVYYYLQISKYDVSKLGWLPVTSVSIFIIAFSLGFGPIPWMYMPEIFPPQILGLACSIAAAFNWICAFIVTASFNGMTNSIGNAWTFWLFTIISAIGTAFVIFLVPETKGKTLEEVQLILEGKTETSNGPNEIRIQKGS